MSSKKGAGKRAIAGAGQSKEEKNAIRRRAKVRARRWHRMISPWHMCIGAVVFGLIAGGLSYSGVLEGGGPSGQRYGLQGSKPETG